MKNDLTCEVVQDLLPSYVDHLTRDFQIPADRSLPGRVPETGAGIAAIPFFRRRKAPPALQTVCAKVPLRCLSDPRAVGAFADRTDIDFWQWHKAM